jgi:hypothetical protein
MSAFSRAARLLRDGVGALLDMLLPEPSLEEQLAQVLAAAERVRAELGVTVASSHLARKRGASRSERQRGRALEEELERLLASLASAEEELRRELAGRCEHAGDSTMERARDPLDSPARERRIRARLRELRDPRRR